MSTTRLQSLDSELKKIEKDLTDNTLASNFNAERAGLAVLESARATMCFQTMCAVLPMLATARARRVQAAIDCTDGLNITDTPFDEEESTATPGVHLYTPLAVAADARRHRLAALEHSIPALIACREPLSQMGLCPVVSIGRVTVRTQVPPPKKKGADIEWVLGAIEDLGDSGIAGLDPGLRPIKRVDAIMDILDSIPEHALMHEVLVEACEIAAQVDE